LDGSRAGPFTVAGAAGMHIAIGTSHASPGGHGCAAGCARAIAPPDNDSTNMTIVICRRAQRANERRSLQRASAPTGAMVS
jgi:hypothetical protein